MPGQKPRSRPAHTQLTKKDLLFKAFDAIWSDLFSTQTHLDSALSKQLKTQKSMLAQIVPTILLRPASQAEAYGIGVGPNEPWSLDDKAKASWRPARLLAERIYEGMTDRPMQAEPMREDFPAAMTTEWEESWGKETAEELVSTLAMEAPLSLRASQAVGPKALLTGLKEMKIPVKAEVSEFAPLGVRLAGYVPVLNTEWYEKAAFEIQDEGSQMMSLFALWPEKYAQVLSKKPGAVKLAERLPSPPKETPAWTVIDACAGAGGKSLAIADAMQGKGRIYSYDTSERKLQALRRRASHAGYRNIQAVAVEEEKEAEALKKFRRTANVVLVDAPCSGWGVLRRNPDIKWRQSRDVLERMPKIQARLLSTYSELVAPGGRLVFGVCTFRKSETLDIVEEFARTHPDFEKQEGGYLGPGPCDGFFMQAFQRKS